MSTSDRDRASMSPEELEAFCAEASAPLPETKEPVPELPSLNFFERGLADVLNHFYEMKKADLAARLTAVGEDLWKTQGDDIERHVKQVLDDFWEHRQDEIQERLKVVANEMLDERGDDLEKHLAGATRGVIDENIQGWLTELLKGARKTVSMGIISYIGGFAAVTPIYWLLKYLVG